MAHTAPTRPADAGTILFPGADRLPRMDEDFCAEVLAAVFRMRKGHFPGSMPVPLLRENMEVLRREPYWVSRKSDGERAMLVLCKSRDGRQIHALVDRKMQAWNFPVAASEIGFTRGIIADCEIIVHPPSGSLSSGSLSSGSLSSGSLSLVIFEVALYFGLNLTGASMSHRISLSDRLSGKVPGVDASYVGEDKILESGGIVPRLKDTSIHTKVWVPVKDARKLWTTTPPPPPRERSDDETHRPGPRDDTELPQDGLIFMPEDGPMPTGTSKNVFKHKSAHTVDLMFECEERGDERQLRLLCMMKGQMLDTCAGLQYKGTILRFRPQPTPESSLVIDNVMETVGQKAILECELRIDGSMVYCLPKRMREDKMRRDPRPNDYRTILGALAATEDPIGLEEIMELVEGR